MPARMFDDAMDNPTLIAKLEAALTEDSPANWDWDLEPTIDELGERAAVEAIPLIVGILDMVDLGSWVHEACERALSKMGAPGVEPLLEAYARTKDDDTWFALEGAMVDIGVRDPRILRVLLAALDRDVDYGAGLLARYGDPSVLPELERALEEFELDSTSDAPLANHAVIELVAAIEDLGGVVSKQGRAKLAAARRSGRLAFDKAGGRAIGSVPMPVKREPKVGRNDACWCGSGKKYKRCHLRADGEGADSP